MILTAAPAFAQIGGIENSVNDVSQTIRTIFPILLGVIFLVGFLFNAGHFFGENADLKKGYNPRADLRSHCRSSSRNIYLSH